MTESEIVIPLDPSTGLPALHEGQFWRVAKNPPNFDYNMYGLGGPLKEVPLDPFLDASHSVQLIETKKVPVQQMVSVEPRRLFKKKTVIMETVDSIEETVLEDRNIGVFREVHRVGDSKIDEKEMAKVLKEVGPRAKQGSGYRSYTHYTKVADNTVDDASILDTAMAIMTSREEKRLQAEKARLAKEAADREKAEREARAASYEGDFPPRTLLH